MIKIDDKIFMLISVGLASSLAGLVLLFLACLYAPTDIRMAYILMFVAELLAIINLFLLRYIMRLNR